MQSMTLTPRQKKVLDYISTRTSCTIDELCTALHISPSTARRAFSALDAEGLIQRYRGGAACLAPNAPEPPVVCRSRDMLPEKAALARKAASFIHDGDVVLLTAGSTIYQICRYLGAFRGLTVLTDSLLVLQTLSKNANIQLIMLGGVINTDEQCATGFLTLDHLAHFNIDIMFTSAKALSIQHGLLTDDLQHMAQYRAFMQHSGLLVALMDHTKLYQTGKAVLYNYSEIGCLLLDDAVPSTAADALREQAAPIVYCSLDR